MAETFDPRFGTSRWSVGSDAWPEREGWNALLQKITSQAAIFGHGPIGSRPAPTVPGRFWLNTTTNRLSYSDGTAWRDTVAPAGWVIEIPGALVRTPAYYELPIGQFVWDPSAAGGGQLLIATTATTWRKVSAFPERHGFEAIKETPQPAPAGVLFAVGGNWFVHTQSGNGWEFTDNSLLPITITRSGVWTFTATYNQLGPAGAGSYMQLVAGPGPTPQQHKIFRSPLEASQGSVSATLYVPAGTKPQIQAFTPNGSTDCSGSFTCYQVAS